MATAVTVIHPSGTVDMGDCLIEDDALWVEGAELTRALGWEFRPEGACQGGRCVPLPDGERGFSMVRDGKRYFNLTALADLLRQPWAAQPEDSVWCFGREPESPSVDAIAPDFTLPDIDGKLHSLSDYRGSKVFLLAWASW